MVVSSLKLVARRTLIFVSVVEVFFNNFPLLPSQLDKNAAIKAKINNAGVIGLGELI